MALRKLVAGAHVSLTDGRQGGFELAMTTAKVDHALSGEAGLSGVRWLLAGHVPRGVLRTQLSMLLGDTHGLGPCRLQRVKFRPGRELRAYFDIDLQGSATTTRPVMVSWRPARKFSKQDGIERIEAEILNYASAAPFNRLHDELPEWGMRVTVAPLDPTLPELGRLSDPRFVGEVFGSARDESAISLLRYFPGSRHVMRFGPARRDSPDATFFVKICADETLDRVLRISEAATEWLASNNKAYVVLTPSRAAAHNRAAVYPSAEGMPLSRVLRGSLVSAERRLSEAGAFLRIFHQTPLDQNDLESRELDHQLRVIRRAGQHIEPLYPSAGRAFHSLLDQAEEIYGRLPNEPQTLVHGDFKADHLFVTQHKLSLLDLDNCRLADPAFDAGKMLADLHWWYGMRGRRGQEDAQRAFLQGYLQENESHRLARARLWEVLFLTKIAARRIQIFKRDWAPAMQRLMAETAAAMQRVESKFL